MAERARFELAEPLPARQFSRLFPSTTRAPLRVLWSQTILTDYNWLVERLTGNCRDPNFARSMIFQHLGCVVHCCSCCHDIIQQKVGDIRINLSMNGKGFFRLGNPLLPAILTLLAPSVMSGASHNPACLRRILQSEAYDRSLVAVCAH